MASEIAEGALHTWLDMPYDEAVDKVVAALKDEGFGVLTEIDVQATLRKIHSYFIPRSIKILERSGLEWKG